MKSFEIPGILDSLRADVDARIMTIEHAAEELYHAGWINFIDIRTTMQLLCL